MSNADLQGWAYIANVGLWRVDELSLLKKIGLYTGKNCIFLISCCYVVVLIYRFIVRYVCVFNRNELFEIYSNMNLLVILHGVVQFYE